MKTYDIKTYETEDFPQVIQFLNDHIPSKDRLDDYQKRLTKMEYIFLVLDQGNLMAMCVLDHRTHELRGHTLDIDITIGDHTQTKDLLHSLYPTIEASIDLYQSTFIVTSCEKENNDVLSFWKNHGFSDWFTLKSMVHDGRKLPYHHLSYRTYQDSDFDMYFEALGQSFEPMRSAMDITPYNVSHVSIEKRNKEKEEFIKERERIYMFFDHESFIGTAIIDHAEIDDFYVAPAYQGKGYGRKIIEDVINLAMKKTDQPIHLTVVDWNEKAKALYHSIGFQVVKTEIYLRKLLH